MNVFTLSNGVRVSMEKLEHLRSISVGFWVGAGCYAEDETNNGISHFIEHMLFKGTLSRSAKEIASCIDALGGQLNAFTAKECTCYYVNILSEHYGIAIDLLSDMLLNAKMDESDIEREKGVVCEEISMVEDTPDEVAHEALARAYFGKHPLGSTILGSIPSVNAISKEDIEKYMAKTYVPENIVISVAGNFDEQEILAMLEEKVGSKLTGVKAPEKCPPLQEPANEVILINRDIEQVNLCLAFPGAAQTSDDYFAQNMICNILGGGMSSRLFQRVREQNGMTYAIYAYLSSSVNSGMVTIYAGMNPSQAPKVYELILDEINNLVENGITEKEFSEAREQLKGSFVLGLESATTRMHRNGKVLLLNDNVLTVDEVLEKINSVTKEDIARNINSMFAHENVCASAVGKLSGDDDLVKMLKRTK